MFGLYERDSDSFRQIDPARDTGLPALAGWLEHAELLAYRPTRRATLRASALEPLRYVKLVRPKRVTEPLRRLESLARIEGVAQPPAPRLPRLIDASPADGVFVLSAVTGDPLRSLLAASSHANSELLSRVAESLVALQRIPVADLDLPPRPPQNLDRWRRFVAEHDPELAAACANTLELLESATSRPTPSPGAGVLVHGDLHDHNILIDDETVGLIDIDSLSVAAPADDVGNLAAHMVLRALQSGTEVGHGRALSHALLEAYLDAGGVATRAELSDCVARTFFRLACVYRFRRRWLHLPEVLLDEARTWASAERTETQPPIGPATKPITSVARGKSGEHPSCPYLFVVGCPRSGTTLLQRMLDSHPSLAVACDTHFIPRVLDTVTSGALEAATGGAEIALTREIVEDTLDDPHFTRLGLDEPLVRAVAEEPTYTDFVSALSSFASLGGKALAGDKTPDYVRWIPLLSAMFPGARFVHLIRDGRDVALSALEWATPTKGPGRLELWTQEPVAVSALWWRWLVGSGRDAGRDLGARYYELRYEHLVTTPEAELRRLCEFLELPYSDRMATFHEGRTRAEPGFSAKQQWLPATPGLRDWRSAMKHGDVELFGALAGDLLAELGYPVELRHPSEALAPRVVAAQAAWSEHRDRRRHTV